MPYGKLEMEDVYRYEEERGVAGALLGFFFWLLLMGPAEILAMSMPGYYLFKAHGLPWTNTLADLMLVFAIAVIAAGLIAAGLLYVPRSFVIPVVKKYLIIKLCFSITFIVLTYVAGMVRHEHFSSILLVGIEQLVFAVLAFLLWFIYWGRSKRVKLRYNPDPVAPVIEKKFKQ